MIWSLLLLVVVVVVAEGSIVVRGHAITFSSFGEDARRSTQQLAGLLVVRRNLTEPPLAGFVKVIAKGVYLIPADRYADAREGDEVTVWEAKHKGAEFENGTCTEFPLLVEVVPGSRFAYGSRMGDDLYVIRQPFFGLEEVILSSDVLSVEPLRALKLHSKQSRVFHLPPSVSPPSVLTAPDIIIAIADTGLDASHCAFFDPDRDPPLPGVITPSSHAKIASNVTARAGVTDYRGVDGSHGTATTSAALGSNCAGGVVGTASGARVAFYDIAPEDTDDYLYLPLSDGPGVTTYWEYLDDVLTVGGASVVSNSWGSETSSGAYDLMSAKMDEYAYRYPKVVFAQSAGNNGAMVSSPALGKNLVSVGATFGGAGLYNTTIWPDASAHPEYYDVTVAADFSSHGPLPDGRRAPLLYSPGVYEYVAYGYFSPVSGHAHAIRMSGTSFSCPTIAGLAAYLQSKHRERNGGMLPPASLVIATLIAWSVPVTSTSSTMGGAPRPVISRASSSYGYGVPKNVGVGVSVVGSYATGSTSHSYCYRALVGISEPFRIALSWRDVPVVAGVFRTLVNDMELGVYVNGMPIAKVSDHVNTAEMLVVPGGVKEGSMLRIVVWENDGVVERSPQEYSVHLAVRDEGSLEEQATCGYCASTFRERCDGDDERSATIFRYCNATTGEMTSCLSMMNAELEGAVSTCRGMNFDGVVGGGGSVSCVPKACDDGYYYDTVLRACACVTGYQRAGVMMMICDGIKFVAYGEGGEQGYVAGPSLAKALRATMCHRALVWLLVVVLSL